MLPQRTDVNHLRHVRNNLVVSIILNLIIPVLVYLILRHFIASDITSLVISDLVPVLRTFVLWVWRRRVDWMGVISGFFFTMSAIVSFFVGGSSLPLKLYHPLISGSIGLVLLVSVAVKRPLLLIFLQFIKRIDSSQLLAPTFRRKTTVVSGLLGLVLLGDAVVHIIMALSLPTGAFFTLSHGITLTAILLLVGVRWAVQRKRKG